MKAIIERAKLADAVRLVASVCGKNKNHPVMENLRVQSADGVLTVSGSNLQDTIHVAMAVEGEEAGTILIRAVQLRDFLAADQADEVSLTATDGSWLKVRGRVEARFRVFRDEVNATYPQLESFPESADAELPAETLLECLKTASRFVTMAADSNFPSSVLLREEGGLLTVCAIDRAFLAFMRKSICEVPQGFSVAIPKQAIDLLLHGDGAKLEVAVGDHNDLYRIKEPGGSLIIAARRDDRPHPAYERQWQKMDKAASFKIKADQARLILGAIRTMQSLDEGVLKVRHDGAESMLLSRQSTSAETDWSLAGIKFKKKAEPFLFNSVYPELPVSALEVLAAEEKDITVRYDSTCIRMDGGSETSFVLASYQDIKEKTMPPQAAEEIAEPESVAQ